MSPEVTLSSIPRRHFKQKKTSLRERSDNDLRTSAEVSKLEGLSTGVIMDASAPHLIHKWLNESRQSPSFMLLIK